MPHAVEIRAVSSGGFKAALLALVPAFERESGHKVAIEWGSSLGNAATSIPSRLRRGDPLDLVILSGDALDGLIAQGRIVGGSRVDLARSGIGVAVRAGASRPDIGSVDAFKRALRQARSIAHSSSASGVGIDFVGPLPAQIQEITVFAAGIPAGASHPEAARALVEFLAAPAAAPIIRMCGMEPG
jgi:molybdate transport system substrate-binding protein